MIKQFWKGINAIEITFLLLVLAVGIFLVWPRLARFQCRAIQSEARHLLYEIYATEKLYHIHHASYASFEDLTPPKSRYYVFSILHHDDKFFIIEARNKNQDDVWSIDEKRHLKNAVNKCES